MPRILLVKTSSLGDVVHNLPVASDIRAQVAGAEIHWVVEESVRGDRAASSGRAARDTGRGAPLAQELVARRDARRDRERLSASCAAIAMTR